MTSTVARQVQTAMAKSMQTGERGFGYVFLLVLIAVIGFVTANSVQLGQAANRRASEQALLTVGRAFEAALFSYSGSSQATPNGNPTPGTILAAGPMQLEDLIKDPRFPGLKRHIRKIFPDPVSGKTEWGLIRDEREYIVGIYSLSREPPIKTSGFDAAHAHFEKAESYQDWRFGLPVAKVLAYRARP